jgi:phosphate:Na+ symporter
MGMVLIPSLVALAAVFMFAVQKFSRQMDGLFGVHVRAMLERATSTPVRATAVGALVTVVLQSSSAVSVLLVSLAEAGLLSVRSSLGVIIGANIGSTITSSLVALQVLDIAPYVVILGYVLMKVETRAKVYGKAVFYFGLLFSCLHVISALTAQDASMETIARLVQLSSNLYMGILIGCVVTVVLQSSSVLSGVIVILAMQGVVSLDQAFAIILGANVGTTSTALVASMAGSVHGKRVAIGHMLFNVVGVAVFLPIVHMFTTWVATLSSDVSMQVVIAHTVFNVVSAIAFLVFFKQFEQSVRWLVPVKEG